MIILSNGLTPTADEGAVKIAVSLIRRIKQSRPDTTVVTYERQGPESDIHLNLNKFLLNRPLIRLIREKQEPVLYVPFPSRMLPAALRIFILSRFARYGLKTLVVMNGEMNGPARWLIRAGGSQILTVSRQTWEIYRTLIGNQAKYLKTGVDTVRFCPADAEKKAALRAKYGLPQDKPIVLHVGHMTPGRNVGKLLGISENWHIVLTVSTMTAAQQDVSLRQQLTAKPNLTLFDGFLPDIQELYQLADVYLFPVAEPGHCIDVPLSALEAAACGIPVAATPYGELTQLLNEPGFYPIETFEPHALEALLEQARREGISPRESVLDYEWEKTVSNLLLDI